MPMSTTWASPRPEAAIVPPTPESPARPRPSFFGALFSANTHRRSAYALASLPLGVLFFTLTVVGLSLSLGLFVTLLGVPILLLTFALIRGFARFERAFGRAALGTSAEEPLRKQPSGPGFWRRIGARISDPWSWREVAYMLVHLPMSVLMFSLTVAFWAYPVAALTINGWWWAIPDEGDYIWSGNELDHPLEWVGVPVAGLALLFLTPWVVRGITSLHAAILDGLLGTSRAELEAQAQRADAQRARSVDSAATGRRRIERDLHDGAQARLVALAIDLGRAREKLDVASDDDEAAALVAEAHEEAKSVLVELRNLARGIHPAILTDRGLDAALSSLAARSPVPVSVNVDVNDRPSPAVEAIAYFAVAEALTNIARHANASRAEVAVSRRGDRLAVSIHDNGTGGADPVEGTGLAGLAERVESADGSFRIISPAGGPTTVLAELPCR